MADVWSAGLEVGLAVAWRVPSWAVSSLRVSELLSVAALALLSEPWEARNLAGRSASRSVTLCPTRCPMSAASFPTFFERTGSVVGWLPIEPADSTNFSAVFPSLRFGSAHETDARPASPECRKAQSTTELIRVACAPCVFRFAHKTVLPPAGASGAVCCVHSLCNTINSYSDAPISRSALCRRGNSAVGRRLLQLRLGRLLSNAGGHQAVSAIDFPSVRFAWSQRSVLGAWSNFRGGWKSWS
jgi:hypothetical protein